MSDDYLWEGTGEPDPEVERLERLLGRYRYEGEPPMPRRRPWGRWITAVAAMVVVAVALGLRGHEGPRASWQYETSTGAKRALAVGDWLETAADTSAHLDVADIGRLDVMPESRLRLLRTGEDGHRLHLARGAVHALVDAPPRLFVIETPATDAVDLGCEYTLEVDAAGNGRLAVQLGYVALGRDGREIKVPRGAVCLFREGRGAGTPWFSDAPEDLRDALARLDAATRDEDALTAVLAAARDRDTLSLLDVLTRVERASRGAVYDRIADLVDVPAGVTRDGVLALDAEMLDTWWSELEWGVWY